MLVFSRVDIFSQFVGGFPELFFERFIFDFFYSFRHEVS
jgi:hypothetical protein